MTIERGAAASGPRLSVDRTAPFLWYTLRVIPQSQARVCQRAKELGFETYAPMSRTPPQVRRFGRKRVVAAEVRPLMPGYVFVAMPSYRPRFDRFQPFDRENDRPDNLRRTSTPDTSQTKRGRRQSRSEAVSGS